MTLDSRDDSGKKRKDASGYDAGSICGTRHVALVWLHEAQALINLLEDKRHRHRVKMFFLPAKSIIDQPVSNGASGLWLRAAKIFSKSA